MVFITADYQPGIVVLSFAIAFIGSYATISLCEQFRLNLGADDRPKILSTNMLVLIMACSLGGVGIWGMHFVGMSAMTLRDKDGSVVHVRFDIFPLLLSLVFAVLFVFCGLYVSSFDVIFTKTKSQIVELFVENSEKMSKKQIRNFKTTDILQIIATESLQYLSLGGVITGSGVVCMHYVGMWGMHFNGKIVWNEGIVAASIIIALVASVAAFWILFRLLSLFPHLEYLRFVSAFVMAVAVTGMHFVGMMAGKWDLSEGDYSPPPHVNSMGSVSSKVAFYGALMVSVAVVCILMALALADLRAWLYETATQLDRAEALLYKIDDHCYSVAIHHYRDRKRTRYMKSPEEIERASQCCYGVMSRYKPSASASISPFDHEEGELDQEKVMYMYLKGFGIHAIPAFNKTGNTAAGNSDSSIADSNKNNAAAAETSATRSSLAGAISQYRSVQSAPASAAASTDKLTALAAGAAANSMVEEV